MTEMLPVIHVVDDDASFRNSVARLLTACGYQVACTNPASNSSTATPGMVRAASCSICNCRASTASTCKADWSRVNNILPIVFLTGHGDIPMSVRAIKAGADDVLSKPVAKDDLLGAVERALSKYSELRRRRDGLNSMRALVNSLTPREREVFVLVVRGKMNKQIAGDLGTSERTIKAHRHAVMEKLKVQSLAEAVAIAERLGMLDP